MVVIISDSKLDVAYTFSLEHDDHDNETLSGEVTAIKVNIADVVPSKMNNGELRNLLQSRSWFA